MGTPLPEPRKVALDLNVRGAWRRVLSFDLDQCDAQDMLDAAELLAKSSIENETSRKGVSMRLQALPADIPLMYWDKDKGWEESRHAR
jgi:hypothetical protein